MAKIDSVKVIDVDGRVISEFKLKGDPPSSGDVIWVPDNGDKAYYILGRRFDYRAGTVTLNCRENAELEKDG